jgi:hypothetical protein
MARNKTRDGSVTDNQGNSQGTRSSSDRVSSAETPLSFSSGCVVVKPDIIPIFELSLKSW